MAYEAQKHVLFVEAAQATERSLNDLVAHLSPSFRCAISGLFVYVRDDDDDTTRPLVRLSIARGPDVLKDAMTIAEVHASGRDDRDRIAACNARIEIAWKPDEWDDVTEIVVAIAPDLEELAHGITWFANVKELSDGSW